MPNDTPTFASFNPTGNDLVAAIKAKTDELIALVETIETSHRRKAIAVTNYEQAAMWAVKAIFS